MGNKTDSEIVSYVAKIYECKGRQELFTRQKPVELEHFVEIARVQSTEASNKIEGIVTTSTRIKQLMNEKTTERCFGRIVFRLGSLAFVQTTYCSKTTIY